MTDTCDRKRAFYTLREANKVGKTFKQRAYECPTCHCWHLTKKKKRTVRG